MLPRVLAEDGALVPGELLEVQHLLAPRPQRLQQLRLAAAGGAAHPNQPELGEGGGRAEVEQAGADHPPVLLVTAPHHRRLEPDLLQNDGERPRPLSTSPAVN